MRDGYEEASTNKIARVAGVSIGSLYQYFPSKEALVAAVIDHHQREMLQSVRSALAKVATRSIKTAARELVKGTIDAHRIDPKLHRVLSEQIPRVGRMENVAAFERDGIALVSAYLNAHRAELAVDDVEYAAFVCVTAVEALTHTAVVNRTTDLSEQEAEQLVEHVTRLVVGYLCR